MTTSFEVSGRMFKLLLVLGSVLCLFWIFRMYEIWNSATGGYVREISVEAEGSAYVVPDMAVIRLGVTTEGEDSADVVAENTAAMDAVLAAIKALEIEDSNVQTVGYYLSPSGEYDDDGNYIETGYTLDQSIEVKLTDFDKIGTLITGASEAGATSVDGVDFTVEDPDAAKAQAREEAITRAKEKADQIAETADLKLGKMVNYYEYDYEEYGKGSYYDSVYSDYAMEGEALEAPVIRPGEEEVTLTVTLTYQIR